ncbi:hypothetical protein [Lentimicrobium sp.]|mgnify:FL=1|uniref:hypothetical protein n=1 Tax=Lentimicrobium sp. TaxID=2034841 RepID=UPI002D0C5B25|nr:hypothetical protein [Lentimicrobium sp.]HPJ62429.1 hypothetical protein [Lentimicrobium sp.]
MINFMDVFTDAQQWLKLFMHDLADAPWALIWVGWILLYLLFLPFYFPGKDQAETGKLKLNLMLQGLIAGALSGLLTGVIFAIAPLALLAWLWITLAPALLGILSGLLRKLATGKWNTFDNALRILAGNFYIEPGQTFFRGIMQGLGRQFWEQPQTLIGNALAHLLNSVWLFEKTIAGGGATFMQGKVPMANGVTFGSFILVNDMGGPVVDKMLISGRQSPLLKLLRHEYGHYLQNRESGWLYLFKYGIPSAGMVVWPEKDAEFRSDRYLLIQNGTTPLFRSYGETYQKIKPVWWEFALMFTAIITAAVWGGPAAGVGAWLLTAGVIAAFNLKNR